ncbi:class I SAM-dependent methyltransferase [Novosphingobium sp. Leaf2]|uniref:class I SAM-dependent methyltransferase n=1 Tax=Novosphingobium sp. Leaf2 TaxID=1735670 RepID=UPI0006FEF3A7|nr:class I SAM-dependent methyltransferase [Novosphingobium sp. Leaf2]KQM22150.1 methyltransferase [Novosphingobium sp. Leaf2]
MSDDPAAGWEGVAAQFAAMRSNVGADVVKRWSRCLPPAGAVLDIGCGNGLPISKTLAQDGFAVWGVDASPTLLAQFRQNVPGAKAACEAALASRFFDRQFDGVVAIGLMFLLPEADQRAVIARVGMALHPGGHFLFSAPRQPCEWTDTLTGRRSVSLGEAGYHEALTAAGFGMVDAYVDDGANDYFHAVSSAA